MLADIAAPDAAGSIHLSATLLSSESSPVQCSLHLPQTFSWIRLASQMLQQVSSFLGPIGQTCRHLLNLC